MKYRYSHGLQKKEEKKKRKRRRKRKKEKFNACEGRNAFIPAEIDPVIAYSRFIVQCFTNVLTLIDRGTVPSSTVREKMLQISVHRQ